MGPTPPEPPPPTVPIQIRSLQDNVLRLQLKLADVLSRVKELEEPSPSSLAKKANISNQFLYESLQAIKIDQSVIELKLSGLEVGGVKVLDFFNEQKIRNGLRKLLRRPADEDTASIAKTAKGEADRANSRLDRQRESIKSTKREQPVGSVEAYTNLRRELSRLEERINGLATALG
jgi:hypothetical protein